MLDELSGNIIAESRKRVTFGGFIEESMQLLLEGMYHIGGNQDNPGRHGG